MILPDIEFFDSNIVIAATIPFHTHHESCRRRLESFDKNAACAAHSLAEVYSTLTRSSKGYGLPLTQAMAVLRFLENTYTLVALTPSEQLTAIALAGDLGLRGAIVYDALIVACARKVNASNIYTQNTGHLRRVAPDLAHIIREA